MGISQELHPLIINKVVYIEGRNGNSQAKYAQQDTLRAFEHLREQQVTIGRSRADSASYQKQVVKVVEGSCERLYIRAKRSASMDQRIACRAEDEWKQITLDLQKNDVAELGEYRPFGGQNAYRLMVSRIKRSDSQANLTIDTKTSPEDIVAFYNGRGGSERVFDVMNNDFSWSKLPLFVPVGKYRLYDSHGHHCQLLSLPHQPILRIGPVAEGHLAAEEVYLPYYWRPGQMD